MIPLSFPILACRRKFPHSLNSHWTTILKQLKIELRIYGASQTVSEGHFFWYARGEFGESRLRRRCRSVTALSNGKAACTVTYSSYEALDSSLLASNPQVAGSVPAGRTKVPMPHCGFRRQAEMTWPVATNIARRLAKA